MKNFHFKKKNNSNFFFVAQLMLSPSIIITTIIASNHRLIVFIDIFPSEHVYLLSQLIPFDQNSRLSLVAKVLELKNFQLQ